MNSADWTALGTIVLAVATLAAVVVTIRITRTDRNAAAERLERERRAALDREQLGEAYAVQVVSAGRSPGGPAGRVMEPRQRGVLVVNHGRYTIVGVEAMLLWSGPDGGGLAPFGEQVLVPGTRDLDEALRDGMDATRGGAEYLGRLTRWDAGMRFESAQVPPGSDGDAFPVVRWRDQWETRWEHRLGQVRQLRATEKPW